MALTLDGTTGITASGNVTGGNIITAGSVTATGNITGGNVSITGTLTPATITATGNITGGNVTTTGTANIGTLAVTGTSSHTGNATFGNISATGVATVTGNITGGNLSGTNIVGTLTTAAQTNITSVGTLTSLAVTGNITGGNILGGANVNATTHTGTTVNVTGNITGGNLTTAGLANVGSLAVTAGATIIGNANVGNLGTVALVATGTGSFGGNVSMNSRNITGLAVPVNSTDAATKQYVDDVAQGLHTHDSCNAATQTTLASISGGTVTYNNGTSGVGATLTTTGTYTTIDGVTLTNGMRILVKNEVTAANNGIYVRTSATVLTRADDFDTPVEMAGGDFTFVSAGTLYDNTGWVMPDAVTTVGTSAVTWVQFSGAGTYNAGTGLTLTGTTFSVNASQTQVTTVGTLGSLAVTGNITSGNLSGTSIAGTLTTAAQPNITSVGTLTSLAVTGNITSGNLSGTSIVGTLTTAAQTNITSVGTLGALTVSGNISGGNISTAGNLAAPTAAQNTNTTQVATTAFVLAQASSTTPTTIGTNTIGTGTTFARADHTHTGVASLANGGGITASVSTGAVTLGSTATNANTASAIVARDASGNFSAGTITATLTGAATTAGTVTTAAQGNITSVGTLTGLTVSGLIQPNANATIDLGATAARFNNVYGVTFIGISNQAKYADLAENYQADAEYAPGTVVSFGGSNEVTQSNVDSDTAVAGVVSANPAYLMNSHQEGTHVIALALQGRVLCNVTGFINKGDLLVSAGNGRARTEKTPGVGTVIGKALQNHAGGDGVIEVVVGVR